MFKVWHIPDFCGYREDLNTYQIKWWNDINKQTNIFQYMVLSLRIDSHFWTDIIWEVLGE